MVIDYLVVTESTYMLLKCVKFLQKNMPRAYPMATVTLMSLVS